jgi:hypothetical protein
MKCRRCEQEKDLKHFYKSSRNKSGFEHICKPCKSIDINARRYGMSESFLEYLYSHEQCMCCGGQFASNKQRHIHHTKQGIQGLICIHCNHIIGQETASDLQRIEQALAYMKSSRENLFDRDNQQERLHKPGKISKFVEESSETIRCESQVCSQCKRILTLGSFGTRLESNNPSKVCWDCTRSNVRLSSSRQAIGARNKATSCACCGYELADKKCVHHVGDTVIGVVCNRCNQLLGNESEQRKMRLLVCKLWVEDSQWDYDRVRSAWRHAEVGRNDLPREMVAR